MNPADRPPSQAADAPAESLQPRLAEYLLSGQAEGVVIVGRPPGWQWWHSTESVQGARVMTFDSLPQCLDAMPLAAHDPDRETTPENCVALMQIDEPANDRDLAGALGQAVRRFPARLVVSVASTEPDDAAFFAFGFRKLQMETLESTRLFEYCLSEYKQTPDWLNARYWAHPERFSLDDDSEFDSEDGDDEEE